MQRVEMQTKQRVRTQIRRTYKHPVEKCARRGGFHTCLPANVIDVDGHEALRPGVGHEAPIPQK